MLPLSLALVLGLGAIGALGMRSRGRYTRRIEEECGSRLPLASDGIVVGAAPIDLDGSEGAPAVMLVHGAGDTPQTLRYLAEDLHARGFTVRVPLLPGHGRALRAFAEVDADSWFDQVVAEFDRLAERHVWTGLVGLSMGGALAVRLAAARPTIPALALVAPYLTMPRIVQGAAMTSRLWGPLLPYVRSAGARPSIHDPDERARSLAYGYFTPAALRALLATVRAASAALPRVHVPTVVMQSRDDNRIAPDDALRAFALLGAHTKELCWVAGAHVLTVDRARAQVFDTIAQWLEARGARPLPRQHAG